jgi:hypothetical protein
VNLYARFPSPLDLSQREENGSGVKMPRKLGISVSKFGCPRLHEGSNYPPSARR